MEIVTVVACRGLEALQAEQQMDSIELTRGDCVKVVFRHDVEGIRGLQASSPVH